MIISKGPIFRSSKPPYGNMRRCSDANASPRRCSGTHAPKAAEGISFPKEERKK
jgi:hypothetical protein